MELHGFQKSDISRDDRQNWRSAQRLSIQKLQDIYCAKTNANKGTAAYLKIVWFYVEVFCSDIASLRQRIQFCATVCHSLGIFRHLNESKIRKLLVTLTAKEITRLVLVKRIRFLSVLSKYCKIWVLLFQFIWWNKNWQKFDFKVTYLVPLQSEVLISLLIFKDI